MKPASEFVDQLISKGKENFNKYTFIEFTRAVQADAMLEASKITGQCAVTQYASELLSLASRCILDGKEGEVSVNGADISQPSNEAEALFRELATPRDQQTGHTNPLAGPVAPQQPSRQSS